MEWINERMNEYKKYAIWKEINAMNVELFTGWWNQYAKDLNYKMDK